MGILDELKEEINSHGPYDRADQPDWYTVRCVLKAIDAFEAERPGLVDETPRCPECESLVPDDQNGDTMFAWSNRFQKAVCPDCAKP